MIARLVLPALLLLTFACESYIHRQDDDTTVRPQPSDDTPIVSPLDTATALDVGSPEPANTSCAGVCGLPFEAPGSCQCYPGCVATNVCCDDFDAECADRLFPKPPVDAQQRSRETGGLVGCYFNGIPLWGDVKVVEHHPDIDVNVVEHFEDLKVKWVEHFPNECGLWRIVDHFEDFTIRYVEHHPDLEIKLVEHFPGL